MKENILTLQEDKTISAVDLRVFWNGLNDEIRYGCRGTHSDYADYDDYNDNCCCCAGGYSK